MAGLLQAGLLSSEQSGDTESLEVLRDLELLCEMPLPRTLSENFSPVPPLIFLPLNNYAENSPVF